MRRMIRRLTRLWCDHEFIEHTHKGQMTFECVACGKPLRRGDPEESPVDRQRLEALARMGDGTLSARSRSGR
jgi:hypothetical protein